MTLFPVGVGRDKSNMFVGPRAKLCVTAIINTSTYIEYNLSDVMRHMRGGTVRILRVFTPFIPTLELEYLQNRLILLYE